MQNQLLSELYHRILHSELEILKQSNTTHHVTAFTDAVHKLVTKISEIVKSTKQTSQALLNFIETQLISPSIQIQRHPKSGFLELLRLENQYIQFYTHICVRFMYLMQQCLLNHSSAHPSPFNKREQQFSFLIKQTKIQLMFECEHSLDTLIVQFLEKFKPNKKNSPYNLPFLEKAEQICLKNDLSYVHNWIQVQKQVLKEQWSQKHKQMLAQRSQKKKTGETHRKSRVIIPKKTIIDQDKNTNKQKNEHTGKKVNKSNEQANGSTHEIEKNQRKQHNHNEANRRLSLYMSEKKRRDSENHCRRTIHQERFKYTTKTYTQQIVYTYVNNEEQPILNTPEPECETQPQASPQSKSLQIRPESK